MPHAIRSLCPMITPLTPGILTPATRMPGAVKCTRYQIPGTVGARCGSFDNSGLPEAVRLPLTTQLLLAASPSAWIPTRSSERVNSSSLTDACAKISALTLTVFCATLLPAALAFTLSVPTTGVSIFEYSGKSSCNLSAPRSENAPRITSACHVDDRLSAIR